MRPSSPTVFQEYCEDLGV
jgi:hypothetical protein